MSSLLPMPLICAMLNMRFLLRIKEKFSHAFDDICLYSEVSHLLAHCTFRLTSRRFIQELFQDVQFMPVRPQTHPPTHPHYPLSLTCFTSFPAGPQMYEEAEAILKKLPKPVEENLDPPAES